jgi:WD40 repeat protein
MATGHRAFDGKTRTSVIAAIVAGSPRPMAELQPLTPAAFEYLVQRCIEKDRDGRWQNAHDVKLELLRIGQQRNESPAPVRPARVPWMAAAVAGAIAIAAIGFAIRTARQPKPSPLRGFFLPPAGAVLKPVQLTVLSIAPSGRMITFGTGLGDTRLWVRSAGAEDAHPLSGTEGGQFPFWSPDEKWIAFFAEEKLKKVSLAGTPPVTICGAPKGRDGTWSEDGTILFSPDAESPIHRVAAGGGTSAPLTKLDASQHETSHRWVKLLPDGRHFIYLAAAHADSKKQDQNAVWFASVDKPGDRKLVIRTRYNAAAGGGRLFYAKQGVLVAQAFDAERGELRGEPERIAGDVETDDLYFKSAFDVSRDGTVVYHIHANDLRVIRRDGEVATPIGEKANIRQIVLSPDGNRAAAEVFDDSAGTSDIWIYDLENGQATHFTATPDEHDSGIAWMPDGKSLIYTAGKGLAAGASRSYISSIDGSQRRELANVAVDAFPWSVTPDGSTLVYGIQTRRSDNGDLWMAPIAGGPAKPFLASSENECCATLSPDGKWIAYYTSSDANTIGALSVARFPSGSGKTSIPCDSQWGGLWTTNGIVCFNPAGAFLVPVTASDAAIHFGKPADLHLPTLTIFAASSRDGKRFVYATHEETREEQAIAIVRP